MGLDSDFFSRFADSNASEYLQIFSNAPFAVFISDSDDQILFTNDVARRWFGAYFEFATASSIELIFGKGFKKWKQLRAELENETSASFQFHLNQPPGLIIDVFTKRISLGQQPLFISYIRDITRQKLLEEELTEEKAINKYIIDALPAMIFVKDTENRIVSMNRAYSEVTGLNLQNVAGKNVFDIMENKRLAEDYWKDDLEVIETGLPKRNIIEPMITDEKKWFITDKIPFRDHAGKITGVIGFSIDITERKNAEDALMRSERRFRLLFDSSPDGIVISDLNGKILNTNKAFRSLTNYSVDEIIKLNFRDLTPEKYENAELNFIRSAKSGEVVSDSFEKEYIGKTNVLIPVNVTCWMLLNEAGNPYQMVANVKDLTFQKKAEELEKSLLQKEKEQLEKDLQTKTQQLNSKVTQLIEKNELVNNVIGQLDKLKLKGNSDIDREINSIIHDLKNNTNEDFWAQFETTFGQINQTFYDNIFQAFPNLTNNERKISAFLKMNLSTKDIANITHQSIRSIEMARARLRTKLKLSRKDNLSKFLNQF